jgi:hypothetical protein
MDREKSFEKIIEDYSEEIQEIAKAIRKKIYTLQPKVTEIVWERQKTAGYGTGPKKMSEHFCWILPAKKHVALGFNYGSELPDPKGILEGTGHKFRHFKVRSVADLENSDLTELIKYAMTYKVPPLKE